MNLPFMTHWPDRMPEHLAGKPTYFVEKIWASIPERVLIKWLKDEYDCEYNGTDVWILFLNFGYEFSWKKYLQFRKEGAKIHTIRPDAKKRWKRGMMIDFHIWTGKPYRSPVFKFAPRIPVKSIQRIELRKDSNRSVFPRSIYIDDGLLTYKCVNLIAKNDGFEITEDFFAWFNKDFKGKIIHWTDFKY